MMTSMHQNLLSAAARLEPWGGLLRRLRSDRSGASGMPDTPIYARPASTPARVIRPAPSRHFAPPAAIRQVHSLLRVIRIMDAGQTSAGRILMSGRMADVCAELDRMVEREAALQAQA